MKNYQILELIVKNIVNKYDDLPRIDKLRIGSMVKLGDTEYHYNSVADDYVDKLTSIIYDNHSALHGRITKDKLKRFIVRQIAVLIHRGDYKHPNIGKEHYKKLHSDVEKMFQESTKERTHVFFIHSILNKIEGSREISGVKFLGRDYSQEWLYSYFFHPSKKMELRLCDHIIDYFRDDPNVHIATVSLCGYDASRSLDISRLLIRSTLDSMSLIVGLPRIFSEQKVIGERVRGKEYSFSYTELELSEGFHYQGKSNNHPGIMATQGYKSFAPLIDQHDDILSMSMGMDPKFQDPISGMYKRWCAALLWYAEAKREISDYVAVAKLGVCLDILSGGGKSCGIERMVKNLLGVNAKPLVDLVYKTGRSRILHGTNCEVFASFDNIRQPADELARQCLIEAASRIYAERNTTEELSDQALQSIKSRP